MNAIEGYLGKFSANSVSDKSQASMFNYEQLGSMVTDVFSQIYEQRAMASLSNILYKVDDAEHLTRLKTVTDAAMKDAIYGKYITSEKEAQKIAEMAFKKGYEATVKNSNRSNLAKTLSLGYMALTQSANVYGEALAGGYDRRTAGFTSLLAASGQYALMSNNRMGDWFLDKTTGFSENESKAAVNKIAKSLLKDSQEAMGIFEVDTIAGKKGLAKVASTFKNKLKDILVEPVIESEFGEEIFKRSIIEGVEEVTEQAAIDAAKGIADTMSYLGFTAKQGSFGG